MWTVEVRSILDIILNPGYCPHSSIFSPLKASIIRLYLSIPYILLLLSSCSYSSPALLPPLSSCILTNPHVQIDYDKAGLAQFYCVHCAKDFINPRAFQVDCITSQLYNDTSHYSIPHYTAP